MTPSSCPLFLSVRVFKMGAEMRFGYKNRWSEPSFFSHVNLNVSKISATGGFFQKLVTRSEITMRIQLYELN